MTTDLREGAPVIAAPGVVLWQDKRGAYHAPKPAEPDHGFPPQIGLSPNVLKSLRMQVRDCVDFKLAYMIIRTVEGSAVYDLSTVAAGVCRRVA